MGLRHWINYGGSTAPDRAAAYACDDCRPIDSRAYFRAIAVKASPALTYRWLCQLRIAPYSYDLVDNRGRRSPRELTPEADRIAAGDTFMIFRVTEVAPGSHITGVAPPGVEKSYGPISATYQVLPQSGGTCRIVIKFWLGKRGRLGSLKRAALIAGDAVMTRKQLTTIRDLAERDELRAG